MTREDEARRRLLSFFEHRLEILTHAAASMRLALLREGDATRRGRIADDIQATTGLISTLQQEIRRTREMR